VKHNHPFESTIMNSPHVDRDSHVAALIRSRQAVAADPGDVAAHFNQALALCQLGQWEQAIAVWEHVVLLEPDNAFAYVNMGVAHLEQAQWEQAEGAFTQAIRCRSDHAAAHFGLGITRAQQGQYEAAKDDWEQTLRLDPDHAEARYNLDFLASMPPERTDDAQANSPSVLPSNMAHTAQVEYEVTSQINMLPVTWGVDAPSVPKVPAENKIKLPPQSGPPLDAIVQSVMAAQQDALAGQVAATTRQPQNADEREPAQVRVEPTLRLDGKGRKKEHHRLRHQEASANDNSKGKWMAGGAMIVLALLLTAWGTRGIRNQAVPSSSAGSPAPSGLSVTSASLNAGNQSAVPPSDANTVAPVDHTTAILPQAGQPVPTRMMSTGDTGISRQTAAESIPTYPEHNSAETAANETSASSIHVRKTGRKRTQRLAASSEQASATRRKSRETRTARLRHGAANARSHDEDTFPTHSHTGRADNSEEWTDKIP
jgi:TPR repeat/Tetratricopeptide repeat